MTLLYLAIAFGAGILLGSLAWDAGVLVCDFPAWPWIAVAAALPIAPLLNLLWPSPQDEIVLRWPRSAGFVPPRSSLTPALLAATPRTRSTSVWMPGTWLTGTPRLRVAVTTHSPNRSSRAMSSWIARSRSPALD